MMWKHTNNQFLKISTSQEWGKTANGENDESKKFLVPCCLQKTNWLCAAKQSCGCSGAASSLRFISTLKSPNPNSGQYVITKELHTFFQSRESSAIRKSWGIWKKKSCCRSYSYNWSLLLWWHSEISDHWKQHNHSYKHHRPFEILYLTTK